MKKKKKRNSSQYTQRKIRLGRTNSLFLVKEGKEIMIPETFVQKNGKWINVMGENC